MTNLAQHAREEIDALISESNLTEIDAVAAILLERAWLKGYEAAASEHIASLDRVKARL